jgi:hypothetical protein
MNCLNSARVERCLTSPATLYVVDDAENNDEFCPMGDEVHYT